MRAWSNIVAFVDRDVARWSGKPMLPILIGVVPLLLWVLFEGRPVDAPLPVLAIMIAFAAFWGGLGVWRGICFDWREFRQIQALGAAEDRMKNG